MRWGRRKSTDSGGNSKNKAKGTIEKTRTPSEDHKKKITLKKKRTYEMSNAELKELTNRLQLEKQYKDLRPEQVNKGLKIVKDVTAAGTTLASLYALSKTPLARDIIKVMKKSGK